MGKLIWLKTWLIHVVGFLWVAGHEMSADGVTYFLPLNGFQYQIPYKFLIEYCLKNIFSSYVYWSIHGDVFMKTECIIYTKAVAYLIIKFVIIDDMGFNIAIPPDSTNGRVRNT